MPTLGNLSYTTTGENVLLRAYLLVDNVDSSFLDTGADDGDARAAEILTSVERALYQDHPGMNHGTETLTFAADASSASISALSWNILSLEYVNANDIRNGTRIPIIGSNEAAHRWQYGDENFDSDMAGFAFLSDDRASINIRPPASVESTYTLRYQTKPTTYTSALTEVSAIPDQFINALIFKTAVDLCLYANMEKKMGVLNQRAMAESEKLTEYIASSPATFDAPRMGRWTQPNGALFDAVGASSVNAGSK